MLTSGTFIKFTNDIVVQRIGNVIITLWLNSRAPDPIAISCFTKIHGALVFYTTEAPGKSIKLLVESLISCPDVSQYYFLFHLTIRVSCLLLMISG